MSFKEAKRREESRYTFIAAIMLNSLFITLGFLHLSLWIQITTLSHFLSPIQLSPTHFLSAIIGKYTTFLYALGSTISYIPIVLYTCSYILKFLLYVFKMCIFIYILSEMSTIVKQVNIAISSHCQLFFEVRASDIHSLSKFSVL